MVGETISHYTLLERIGEGAMAVVFKALDNRLGRIVALKLLRQHLLASEHARRRLLREARAAAVLDHPNICSVFEIEVTDEHAFIAMAFVEGQSLYGRLASGPIDPVQVRSIIAQIALGLHHAHTNGIVHRDIKPANIMLSSENQVRLLDFGLARTLEQSRITKVGTPLGTTAYMSPEQARGEEVDHRTDIWSLGVVCFEMLTGQPPFSGDNDQAIIHSILNRDASLPATMADGVPEDLRRIIQKALPRPPEMRYADTNELIRDLALGTRPIALGPPTSLSGYKRKSIAVLPFVNLGPNPAEEWFSDGITEDLISQLSKIRDLKVISRTSVMQYKGTHKRPPQIARELGVATILEGSVRRAADQIRIAAQLIDARTDDHLWAETFDQEMTDVLAIQSQIALQLAGALEAQLSPQERERVGRHPVRDLKAHNLCLQGRYFLNRRSPDGMKKAIGFFQQAIARDPNCAPAHSGIAEFFAILGAYDQLHPASAFPQAIAAARRAIAIDPLMADAHSVLGFAVSVYEWDWSAAEDAHRRAIELSPGSAYSRLWYALSLRCVGRIDADIEQVERARELDPLSIIINTHLATAYYANREYDRAAARLDEVIELDPSVAVSHAWLALVQSRAGNHQVAVTGARRAAELGRGHEMFPIEILAVSCACAGMDAEAESALEEMRVMETTRFVSPYFQGLVYLGLGQEEEALRCVERAAEIRDSWIPLGLPWGEPAWDALRAHPRLKQILNRMALPR